MNKTRSAKTTKKQFEEMLTFIEANKIVLSGKTKPREAKKVANLWNKFAENVNGKPYGAAKTGEQWRKVFTEWKTNVRRKSIAIEVARKGTGESPHKPLGDLEERLLQLISRIHLGDPEVPEGFGVEELITLKEEPSTTTALRPPRPPGLLMIAPSIMSTPVPSSTPVRSSTLGMPSTTRPSSNTKSPNRNLLMDACNSLKNVSTSHLEPNNELTSLLTTLSKSVDTLSEAYNRRTEAYNRKTEAYRDAELQKLKVEYLKVFEDLGGFDETILSK